MTAHAMREIYERARKHGLAHDAALHCVEMGEVRCWCGSDRACIGGANRYVGCATTLARTFPTIVARAGGGGP